MLVVFVAPFFSDNAKRFLGTIAAVPRVRLAVVSQEPESALPQALREHVARYVRVGDALRADDLVGAALQIQAVEGPIHRLLGAVEQIQEALGEARERLGLAGMTAAQARNFRDKRQMKDLLRAGGVPVARHLLVDSKDAALRFAREVGYPIVVKPPAGAASQTTYRATDDASLVAALGPASQSGGGVALLEEFVTGQEHSYDAFVKDGRVFFYSVSDYLPTPLEAMENPWIQWAVLLRREYEEADIADVGQRALSVLGLETGMCHAEWFRRRDGSLVFSEVAGRPGGAQIPLLISRAHDVDAIDAWSRLVTTGETTAFGPRKYATAAAFLRGQGQGHVRAVHGAEQALRDLGDLVTDVRLPQVGQAKSSSYEGEGNVLVRHPDTKVVRDAITHLISNIRVELG
jgi:biotin carboxylase